MTAIRENLYAHIDALPEERLLALTPIVELLSADYWKPVIEPASPEEIAMIDEAMKEYEKDPSSWTDLDDLPDDDTHFVVETDLTDEERAIIAEGRKEPTTPWCKVRRKA